MGAAIVYAVVALIGAMSAAAWLKGLYGA